MLDGKVPQGQPSAPPPNVSAPPEDCIHTEDCSESDRSTALRLDRHADVRPLSPIRSTIMYSYWNCPCPERGHLRSEARALRMPLTSTIPEWHGPLDKHRCPKDENVAIEHHNIIMAVLRWLSRSAVSVGGYPRRRCVAQG